MSGPELWWAEVDAETLGRLLEDLEACAEVHGVSVKAGASDYANGAIALREVPALLATASVCGVQLHYAHQGEEWIDTLMACEGRIRLVRARVPREANRPVRTIVAE